MYMPFALVKASQSFILCTMGKIKTHDFVEIFLFSKQGLGRPNKEDWIIQFEIEFNETDCGQTPQD
jgi:hypothetical protein